MARAPEPLIDPLRRGAWLLMAALLAMIAWSLACQSPVVAWNPQRLAAAYVLAADLPLYPAADDPRQPGWFYGPGFPLTFFPVTLISSPTWALAIATLWNAALIVAPLSLLMRAGGLRGWRNLGGTLLAAFLLLENRHTAIWFSFIHVDGVAVGCIVTMAAAAFIYDRGGDRRWLWLGASAATAAAWTKQTDAVFAVAIGIWWLARRRWRLAWAWVLWCSVAGGVVTAVIFWRFGAERVLFHTVEMHARNPWRTGGWLAPGWALMAELLLWGLAAGAAFAVSRLRSGQRRARPEVDFARLLLWLAAVQLPLGLAAAMKIGGGLNSMHGLVFLAAGIAHYGIRVSDRVLEGPAQVRARHRMIIAVLVCVIPVPAVIGSLGGRWRWAPDPQQDALVKLARENPGRICFPWNPLITLMAEREQMPTEDALGCFAVAGFALRCERVREAIGNRTIVYDPQAPTRGLMHCFPGREFVDGYKGPAAPGRRRVFREAAGR